MRYYFIGICGTAMASLAVLLQQKGHTVWGSDQGVYPPMSDFLQEHHIPVWEGFTESHLKKSFDVAVIGNVLSRGNVEVEAILNRHLPFTSLPELIRREFIQSHTNIVITGTHGKTTTTALTSWVLQVAGLHPTFLVGGIARNFNSSVQLGSGKFFVIEGDEYDCAFFDKRPKFVHYFPDYLIINNIEFDHADIYPDLAAIKDQFRKLLRLVPGKGLVVANSLNPSVQEVTNTVYSRLAYIGIDDVEWAYRIHDVSGEQIVFTVLHNGNQVAELRFPFPGEYQIQNALAVIAVARDLGIDWQAIEEAFRTFQGVKRRFEFWGKLQGASVYDDFAHHPTAIQATLGAARRKFPGCRLVALFEPRTNTMVRRFFQADLANAFAPADVVLITPIHRPERLAPDERLSLQSLADDLTSAGKTVVLLPDYDAIIPTLEHTLQPDDVLLLLTNGSLGGVYQQLRKMCEGD